MPILPVVISHYTFLDTSAGTFDPGHVIVRVLPPIEVEKQGKTHYESDKAFFPSIFTIFFSGLSNGGGARGGRAEADGPDKERHAGGVQEEDVK